MTLKLSSSQNARVNGRRFMQMLAETVKVFSSLLCSVTRPRATAYCSWKKVPKCVHKTLAISTRTAFSQTSSVECVLFSVVESFPGLVVAIHSQDS